MLRVARDLCDEHDAEDAVQEASLRALRHPPRERRALRPWLRRVVVNVVLETFRSQGSRRARERTAAREEFTQDQRPQEAVLAGRIREAIASMREPYRQLLSLRYLEGKGLQQIAMDSGTPIETLRSQHKRGKALLREALDRRFGGRDAWLPALVLLLPKTRLWDARWRWSPGGVLALRGACASLLLVLVAAWNPERPERAIDRRRAAASDPAPPALSDAGRDLSRRTVELDDLSVAAGALEVVGRVVGVDGLGVADAEVFALPADRPELRQPFAEHALASGRADADGAFRLLIESLPVQLVASAANHRVTADVPILAAAPESELELRLVPGRLLSGKAVDAGGSAVPDARVEALVYSPQPLVDLRPDGRAISFRLDLPSVGRADDHGRFELLVSAARSPMVHASHPSHPDGIVSAAAQGELVVRLAEEGTALVRARSPTGVKLPGVHVELFATGVDEPWTGTTDAEGRCQFDGLPGSRYRVVRCSRSDLATLISPPGNGSPPGTVLRLGKQRELRLHDASGAGVEAVRVEAISLQTAHLMLSAGFSATVARRIATILDARTGADGRVAVPGFKGELELILTPPSRLRAMHAQLGTTEKALDVQLLASEAPLRIALRVRSEAGRPLRGLRARALLPDGLETRSGAWRAAPADDHRVAWNHPGTLPAWLEIEAQGHARTYLPGSALVGGAELEVSLAPTRELELRLMDAGGTPLAGAELACTTEADSPLLLDMGPLGQQSRLILDREGRIRLPAAPSSPWKFQVDLEGFAAPLEGRIEPAASAGDPLELRLDVRLGGPRRAQRLQLVRRGDHSRHISVRVLDASGTRLLDERLDWERKRILWKPRAKLQARLREVGRAPRRVALRESSGGALGPALEFIDARTAHLDLPVPEGEAVTIELATQEGLELVLEVPADRVEPLRVRVPRAPTAGELDTDIAPWVVR